MLEELYEENLVDEPNDIEEIIEGDDVRNERENNSGDDQDDDQNANGDANATTTPAAPKKKRIVQNPQPKLNAERLQGPRGISILEDVYKDFKFNGKGYERVDLNRVMERLEHWAHRLYPRFQFDDCLEKIEKLGNKKPVMTYVKKIRMDLLMPDEPMVLVDDEEDPAPNAACSPPIDKFDELLNQQLAQLQSRTPRSTPSTPRLQMATPVTPTVPIPQPAALTDEQKERMHRNRLLAEERRSARLKRTRELEKDNVLNAETSQGVPSAESEMSVPNTIQMQGACIPTLQQLPVDKHNYLPSIGSEQLEKDANNIQVSGEPTLQQLPVDVNNDLSSIVPENSEKYANNIQVSGVPSPQQLPVTSPHVPSAASQQPELSNNETQVRETLVLQQSSLDENDSPSATLEHS